MACIYSITNLINRKKYIGQTKLLLEKRVKLHLTDKGSARMPIVRALKKYGLENFVIEPIAFAYTKEHLDFLEKFYIEFFGSRVPLGYNISFGGIGGGHFAPHSEETKKRLSELKKGKKRGTPAWNRGIPQTEETKRKIGKAIKGRKHSEETKKKIGLGNKGKYVSKETCKKISQAKKGIPLSEEAKEKLRVPRPHSKSCFCPFCRQKNGEPIRKIYKKR